jgi:hypothetical protein
VAVCSNQPPAISFLTHIIIGRSLTISDSSSSQYLIACKRFLVSFVPIVVGYTKRTSLAVAVTYCLLNKPYFIWKHLKNDLEQANDKTTPNRVLTDDMD